MKKAGSLLFSFVLLGILIPFLLAMDTNRYGEFAYSISNGEATIVKYYGHGEYVVIPKQINGYPVRLIGRRAFHGCLELKQVLIPDSVTKIGGSAFFGCSSLERIVVPKSVIAIGRYAFSKCNALTDIYCEAAAQPDGWSPYWNAHCSATVYWGYPHFNAVCQINTSASFTQIFDFSFELFCRVFVRSRLASVFVFPKAKTVFTEHQIKYGNEYLGYRLFYSPVNYCGDAQLSNATVRFRYPYPSCGFWFVSSCSDLFFQSPSNSLSYILQAPWS